MIMGFGAIVLLVFKALSKSKNTQRIDERAGLIASGFLGGEGITGVLLAIIAMFS